MKRFFSCLLTGFFLSHSQAFALGIIVHIQGQKGDREAYFANVRTVLNRTPVDQIFGPIEIRELQLTAVYEHLDKPEWVYMNMWFQCRPQVIIDSEKGTANENPHAVKAGEVATFRIGPGSYKLRRADLKSEPLPESDWKKSNAPMLSKAAAIACNEGNFKNLLIDLSKKKPFDHDKFGKAINGQFNLPVDMQLIGAVLASDFLDYAWTFLWWETVFEGNRPNPSGKWTQKASQADKDAAVKKLQDDYEKNAPRLEAMKKELQDSIAKMDANAEFHSKAAKLRQGRQLNKFETSLNSVWIGKEEQAVIDKMGKPALSDVGNTRFLTYTKYFDNRGYAVHMGSGAFVSEGVYAECFVEFATMQDKKSVWRVADVKVRADGSHNGMAKDLCHGLSRIPD
ncbi:hypothetical protein H8K33_06830 [Undibacterium amnicola]|uniref:Uncharacterized protein n=1 Tax=Undibacterium amnicola TaxID=1834038 RepID=A0ABR6XP14_9BURK|nr:hypothetical protein [Undibacterium amnicola]MBC3831215.1 hypothetical protein [Undibacterium amnicola]